MKNELAAWSSFYVTIGSSAASLTGLTFVVITLVTSMERTPPEEGLAVFTTPTVLHFGTALLIAALLSVPWQSPSGPAICLLIIGLCGLGYTISIMYRTKHLRAYEPDLSDWFCYTILPFVAYAAVFAAGLMWLSAMHAQAAFVIAAGALLLIFLGIRNSWDVVTFLVARNIKRPGSRTQSPHDEP